MQDYDDIKERLTSDPDAKSMMVRTSTLSALVNVVEAAKQVIGAYLNPWANESDRLATIDALVPVLNVLDAEQ